MLTTHWGMKPQWLFNSLLKSNCAGKHQSSRAARKGEADKIKPSTIELLESSHLSSSPAERDMKLQVIWSFVFNNGSRFFVCLFVLPNLYLIC